MHSANNERPSKGALHPIQESAQTAQAVSEISKGLQCALTATTIYILVLACFFIFSLECSVIFVIASDAGESPKQSCQAIKMN